LMGHSTEFPIWNGPLDLVQTNSRFRESASMTAAV
jgi:hypothetical protein